MIKTVSSLAFAAACVAAIGAMPAQAQMYQYQEQLITNGPQANAGDFRGHWSAQRNVAESNQYERLLQSNGRFRQARINKECGPITDPQLHASCLSSFGMGDESVGSSMPPMRDMRDRGY